jgi:hypothetical protein
LRFFRGDIADKVWPPMHTTGFTALAASGRARQLAQKLRRCGPSVDETDRWTLLRRRP